MKKYLSRRNKKKLLAALLTGVCLVTPWNRAEAGGQTIIVTKPNAVLNQGKVLTGEDSPTGYIIVGTPAFPADGEQTRYDTPLPQSFTQALTPTIIHEIGHAMGLTLYTLKFIGIIILSE